MQTFYKYYEVVATMDDQVEVMFGSYYRSDCAYEVQAERDSLKAEGYKHIKITSRLTTDKPDPAIYGV